jgi:hypothetical protein
MPSHVESQLKLSGPTSMKAAQQESRLAPAGRTRVGRLLAVSLQARRSQPQWGCAAPTLRLLLDELWHLERRPDGIARALLRDALRLKLSGVVRRRMGLLETVSSPGPHVVLLHVLPYQLDRDGAPASAGIGLRVVA